MNILSFTLSALTLGIYLYSQQVAAATDIEINAGLEQDSNLNIVELDQHSEESDLAALLGLKLDANSKLSDRLTLAGGYTYNSKTYQTHKNFNLALHQLYADIKYDSSLLTLGASHHYADAILDKKSFLALHQTSFYVAKLINDRFYLRAATNIQSKNFNRAKERNADTQGFAADAFIFFNQGKSFVSIGLSNDKEDTRASQFDYQTKQYNAKASHKFMIGKKEQKVQLGWRQFERDYSSITEEIETQRYDTGRSIEANWELSFTPHISLETKFEKGEYDSNLAAADYSENRASIKLKARF